MKVTLENGKEELSVQNFLANTPAPNTLWLYRVGGISSFVLVAGYLLTFPVYAWVGDPPPSGIEARLTYFAGHATGWWTILGLMVYTDILYIPVFLSLYQALKEINRNAMLLVTAFIGLFVVLDLSLTWASYPELITFSGNYAAATTDVQRAVFVAATGYPSMMIDSPLLGTYAILIPSLGFLLAGLVMLKGIFNKITSYLALAVGITGIVFMGSYFVDYLGILRIVNALLATTWYLFVGLQLFKLGQQTN